MSMKNKKGVIILTVLLLVNIGLTAALGFAVYRLSHEREEDNKTTQYVMYVGLNDRDTYTQLISTEEAKQLIDEICFRYLDGYTIQDAAGSWVDEKGNATREQTIVCYFNGADKAVVYKIADEVIDRLNQNTVLIERDEIETDFYGGGR